MKQSILIIALGSILPFPQVHAQQLPLQTAAKCAPGLRADDRGPDAQQYMVQTSALAAFESWLQQAVPAAKPVVSYRPANIMVLEASAQDFWGKILLYPGLTFADRQKKAVLEGGPQEELSVPGQNLYVNKINAAHQAFPDINGLGRTISIKENRFDTSDVDFSGRLAPVLYASDRLTTHATIMASLAAGAGNATAAGKGVAWGCRLATSDFAVLLPDTDDLYAKLDVSVQNHSYGVGIENYYGADALAYDKSVALRPALLHVFSAGNQGGQASDAGTYQGLKGFANLSGSFKMAKNALIVGAVDSFGNILTYSSRGPAFDGRLKPDLVAFGHDGSSGAAALSSGAAALLQQAYAQQHAEALPPAALLRAVLINSADDVENPGPDYSSGYGNLNLLRAVQTMAKQQFMQDTVSDGASKDWSFDLPAHTRQLKVTLCWDDPAAAALAPQALLNDLDLVVETADGQSYAPWVLSRTPHPDSLRLPAVRARDDRNNAEQVSIDNPPAGNCRVYVRGYKVPQGPQAFSLAVQWDTSGYFRWTCPMREDAIDARQEVVLRWESRLPPQLARAEYRLAGAGDWLLLDDSVQTGTGYLRWQTPDVFTAAQVRLRAGNAVFESDTFLISRPVRLQVGYQCADSVHVFWNAVAGASAYQLYRLQDRYMRPWLITADTFRSLSTQDITQRHFAVAPLAQNGHAGARSAAPDYTQQGVACYIKSFFATLHAAGDAADLQLQIGTTYGLQEIRIEKWNKDAFEAFKTWHPVPGTVLETQDIALQPGANRYRARLLRSNQEVVYSEVQTVFSAGAKKVWIFPNPVRGTGFVHVARQTSDTADFELMDTRGNLVRQYRLDGYHMELELESLCSGLYFFRIAAGGKAVARGKLVVF